ncbi:hypothetical protein D3C79_1078030 [compost metagenome]
MELAGIALEFVFQELLDGLAFKPNTMRACGFSILVPLDPLCIVGHCHPVDIRDPL